MNKTKVLIAVIVIAVVGFVAARFVPKSQDQILVPPTEPVTREPDATSTSAVPSTPSAPSASASPYKDGTYTARGTYYSPEGLERITVSVTLKDGIIADTSAVNEAGDSTSVRYQGVFIKGYKALIVGKSIDEVKLDKVSGSSLTSAGFNQAIEKIKTEARA